jgi:iron complex outermembrane receptor protein
MGYHINKNLTASVNGSVSNINGYNPPSTEINGDKALGLNLLRTNINLSIENKYDKMEGAFKVYYNYGEHDLSDGWYSEDALLGLNIYESLNLFKNNKFTVGGGLNQASGQSISDSTFNPILGRKTLPLGNYHDSLVYITETFAYISDYHTFFNVLNIHAGLRFEKHSIYGDNIIPAAGFTLDYIKTGTFKGNYSKGYRSPTIRELFYFPPSNSKLNPEVVSSYEFSTLNNFFNGKLKTELGFYYMKGNNFIYMDFSKAGPPSNENGGKIEYFGLEGSFKAFPWKDLLIASNFCYMDNHNPIPYTSDGSLNFSVSKTFFQLTTTFSYTGLYNLYYNASDFSKKTNIDMLNLNINYNLRMVDFYITAKNLLNKEYEYVLGYPMPGTTFFTGIKVNL